MIVNGSRRDNQPAMTVGASDAKQHHVADSRRRHPARARQHEVEVTLFIAVHVQSCV